MLKTIFKASIALGILYWLISQGKLDLTLIVQTFKYPYYFIIGFFLVSLSLVMAAYRLGFLLKIKSSKIQSKNLIGIQWIGMLFATVLPGAFTSDLLKISYIKNQDQELSKSYILFSLLVDRLIGLSSLLFVSGAASLMYFSKLTKLSSGMRNVIYLNLTLFILSVVGLALIFLKPSYQSSFIKFIPTAKLKALAQDVWKLNEQKKKFFLAYGISIISHLIVIIAFWTINIPFFEGKISLDYLSALIPLGHLAVAIPISPGGIGVGHAAFSTLFHFIGHNNGASLYNVYWVLCLVISLFGIFPFVLNKSKIRDNQA